MRKRVAVFFLFFPVLVFAGSRASSGLAFLRLIPDARSAGMAGTGASFADDVFAVWMNPAGLGRVENMEASVSHLFWFGGLNMTAGLFCRALSKAGVVAMAARTFYPVDKTPALNADAEPTGELADYTAFDTSLSFAFRPYLVKIGSPSASFFLGGTVRFASENMAGQSVNGLSFDLGFIGESVLMEDLSFAFVIYHAGLPLAAAPSAGDVRLPLGYRAGLSYVFHPKPFWTFLAAFEADAPNDYPATGRAGAEIFREINRVFSAGLRLGYAWPVEASGWDGLTAGIGAEYKKTSFDYSLGSHGGLGWAHCVTMGRKF